MVVSLTYTDFLTGMAGEVEIVVEDHDLRWQGSWYPALGDEVSLQIGYRGEGLLPCGEFQIDQLELTGPPDTFIARCLAAYITPAMRTRNSVGYEDQTLLGIARTIGGKHGLEVISAPEVIDIGFARVTQNHETDLEFLKRLALEYDYDFTVRGSTLVYYSRPALEVIAPIRSVNRTDVERFEFRNRSHTTYRSAEVAYRDLMSKSLIVQSAAAIAPVPTEDVLKIVSRCENGQQASLKGQAALRSHNSHFIQASLIMPGSIAMASGNTLQLTGFGEFEGIYIIVVARHRLDRIEGYTTRLELSRVF